MLRLFLTSAGRLLLLALSTLRPGPSAPPLAFLRRILVMAAFVPLFALVQLIHWVGLLLDEILFRGYRRVEIHEPLFVLGVPRSGTTHLHRVLAQDPQYTTFSTWECLFAPSVTERRLLMGLGWLDTRIGRPLGRLLDRLERRVFDGMAQVHSMGLQGPGGGLFRPDAGARLLHPDPALPNRPLPVAHGRLRPGHARGGAGAAHGLLPRLPPAPPLRSRPGQTAAVEERRLRAPGRKPAGDLPGRPFPGLPAGARRRRCPPN